MFDIVTLGFDTSSILIISVLVCLILFHQKRKKEYFKCIGIKCAPTWPILGVFPTIMQQGILENDADGIRRYGSVYGSYLGNHPNLVVADPNFIREIFLKQFDKFPYRMQALYISKWWENGVVIAIGAQWKYLRSLMCPTFSTIKLKELQTSLSKCLKNLEHSLKAQLNNNLEADLDIRKFLSALTIDVICCTSFGVEMDTLTNPGSEFSRHAKVVSTLNIDSSAINMLPLVIPGIRSLFQIFDLDYVNKSSLEYIKSFVKNIISKRKSSGETCRDTLQILINAYRKQDKDNNENNLTESDAEDNTRRSKVRGLTEDELIANALIMLMAGYDTTATTLTWMSYLLATNQTVQNKLLEEIDRTLGKEDPTYDIVMKMEYLDWFLCETLRLYPAANRTGRDAAVDTEVCGLKIPKGLSITVPIYAMHRMAEYWTNPDDCIPERFSSENRKLINPYVYIPFGIGPRKCIGMRMAQMLCKLVMVKILQNFKFDVCKLTEIPPLLERSLLTKPVNGLKLKVINRDIPRIYTCDNS